MSEESKKELSEDNLEKIAGGDGFDVSSGENDDCTKCQHYATSQDYECKYAKQDCFSKRCIKYLG